MVLQSVLKIWKNIRYYRSPKFKEKGFFSWFDFFFYKLSMKVADEKDIISELIQAEGEETFLKCHLKQKV